MREHFVPQNSKFSYLGKIAQDVPGFIFWRQYTSQLGLKFLLKEKFDGHSDSCLEPLDQFRRSQQLLLPKAVAKTSGSEVIFSVMNPTPNLQVIKRNVQVATIHPVEKLILVDLPREVNSVKRRDKSDLPDYLQPLIERASSKLTGSERQSLANLVSELANDCR